MYRRLTTRWPEAEPLVVGLTGEAVKQPPEPGLTAVHNGDLAHEFMYRDQVGYLPDDGLAKVDRACSVAGLEARVPLLDHRIVEFAWRLPLSMKVRQRTGKWLLRQVLYRYVPRALVDRPKSGFGVPVGAWLRGPLRDWAEELLGEVRLRHEGYLEPGPIRRAWAEHLSGRQDRQYELWNALVLQAWLEAQLGRGTLHTGSAAPTGALHSWKEMGPV
jgi:asparagine synthase (glutamine-hydrolysing)